MLLAGRFEGVDERVIEARGLEEVSIGDYVLSGGELPAMVVIDACVRLLDGVLGADGFAIRGKLRTWAARISAVHPATRMGGARNSSSAAFRGSCKNRGMAARTGARTYSAAAAGPAAGHTAWQERQTMTEASQSNVKFRPARRADLEAIIAMLADDDLGGGREDVSVPPNPAYVMAFDAIMRDPNQLMAVGELHGDVIACLQISFIPGLSRRGQWRGQIESVRIASGARGTGLGRQLFEWAIEQCRLRGCGLVQLTSDKTRGDAIRFYEGLGFVASHEGFKLQL